MKNCGSDMRELTTGSNLHTQYKAKIYFPNGLDAVKCLLCLTDYLALSTSYVEQSVKCLLSLLPDVFSSYLTRPSTIALSLFP